MTSKELKDRTQKFSLEVIKFVEKLPKTRSADVLGKQLLRSACSVGANYRAALRAQSHTHFISKIGTVEEESDESLFWLELLNLAGIGCKNDADVLMKEANELTAIFTATRKTARYNQFQKNKHKILN